MTQHPSSPWRQPSGGPRRSAPFVLTLLPLLAALPLACATPRESAARDGLEETRSRLSHALVAAPGAEAKAAPAPDFDKGLPAYVAYALDQSPSLRAAYARWEASVLRISRARRLPEPTLGFGYFVQSVETRVGPQLARVSLQQAFPWPTKLTAGADALSAQARAEQRRFDAQALAVTRGVAEAYWNLWQVRRTRTIHQEHLDVVAGLAQTIRGRIATGAATLAEQQQVDLTRARLEDNVRGMDETEAAAAAMLRAALGGHPGGALPTTTGPAEATVPAATPEALAEQVRAHPAIASAGLMAEAKDAAAQAEEADALPSFTVGADWIVTGEARTPGMANSGQDAVVVGAGLKVPLWQPSYADAAAAARADARAQRASQQSLVDHALAELEAALSRVRDASRRVALYSSTLLPQAKSAYASVLGAYTTGRGTVAQALLAQRDILELRVEFERARAEHARAWARLEDITGQPQARATPAAAPTLETPHE